MSQTQPVTELPQSLIHYLNFLIISSFFFKTFLGLFAYFFTHVPLDIFFVRVCARVLESTIKPFVWYCLSLLSLFLSLCSTFSLLCCLCFLCLLRLSRAPLSAAQTAGSPVLVPLCRGERLTSEGDDLRHGLLGNLAGAG